MRKNISLVFLLLIIIIILQQSSPAASAPVSAPPPTPTPAGKETEEVNFKNAVLERANQNAEMVLALLVYEVGFDKIEILPDESWGFAWLSLIDRETGQVLPNEPGLAIAQKVDGAWQVTLQSDPDWLETLKAVPDELISPADKQAWIDMTALACNTAPLGTFTGYKLPWPGGQAKSLSQSITHTLPPGENASYSMFYSFDFYDGTMFPLYAAKAGTVKFYRWTQANFTTDSPGNYIVIEDISTTPTTYVLYLHLAYDSIPTELRQAGAPVQQGQYIGNVDDTGVSTGHHLHFQVHTEVSWWGCSVDVVFNDVSINGGRPRTYYEATYYPQYGNQWQSSYVSSNFPHGDGYPPVGDMLEPFTDSTVVTNGSLHLEGWAIDEITGLASAQFIARWGSSWQVISPSFNTTLFSYDWNLCSSGIPVGALSVALRLTDVAGNVTLNLPGLRQVVNNSNCAPQPPACSPGADQAALFSGRNYTGACIILGTGNYPDASDLGAVGAANAESVLVGSNVRLSLFSVSGYGGRSTTFSQNDSNLRDDPIGANLAYSARVRSKSDVPLTPLPRYPTSSTEFTGTPSLTLVWADAGGAEQFEVELVSGSQTYSSGLLNSFYWHLDDYRFTGDASLQWRVRARNSAGYSAWSAYTTLNIQAESLTAAASVSAPYTDGFESDVPTWQPSSYWQRDYDATLAHGGSYSYVYEGYNSGSPSSGSLTSPQIVVPATQQYALRFYYQYETESWGRNWDQRWIQISVNGGPFQNVRQLTDDEPNIWLQSPPVDLLPYAGQTIQVRLYFATLDGSYNAHDGWRIDDFTVQLYTPPDCSDPGEANETPASAAVLAYNTPFNAFICPPGDVDFYKFSGNAGERIVADIDAKSAGSELDGYLFLFDQDGRSLLAEHDDEIYAQRQDPHLGYQLPRTGTYYLMLRAWDHPRDGSALDFYTLTLTKDNTPPTINLNGLSSGGAIQVTDPVIRANVTEIGSGVSHVAFYWHTSDWQNGAWQLIGDDWDAADGWSAAFDLSSISEQSGAAVSAVAYDWAGQGAAAAAYNLVIDKTAPESAVQPLPVTSESTAIQVTWTASDNLAGLATFTLQQYSSVTPSWQDAGQFPAKTRSAWIIGAPGETHQFRLSAVDLAGNTEAFPPSAEAATTIGSCTSPDAWDGTLAGDNEVQSAGTITYGGGLQNRNFCRLGDTDWVKVELNAGAPVQVMALPMHGSTAPALSLYRSDGGSLTLLDSRFPAGFPAPAQLLFTPSQSGTYYIKLAHIDSRIAGNAVSYKLYVGPPQNLYFPTMLRR